MKNNLPSFEDRYDIICREIEKRRRGWTLAAVSFDDVKQNALIRISQQYNTKYDPRKDNVNRPEAETFLHWLNTVISNLIKNQLRDNLGKFSRPCLTERCVFNVGADSCSKNPSGIQCSECLAYRSWEERKLDHFNIEHLNTLYKNAGFNEYSKYDWNDEYAPPNWNYEKHGRPNVIMRKL